MRRIALYCNLFWLLFSLITCVESYRLGVGSIARPGSGLFPFGAGLVMLLLSCIGLSQSIRKVNVLKKPTSQEPFRWWNIVIVLAAISAFTMTLQEVGFLVNTFVFVTLLLKVVEPQSWKASILGGLITAVAADLVFNVVFQAQIPSGILGF